MRLSKLGFVAVCLALSIRLVNAQKPKILPDQSVQGETAQIQSKSITVVSKSVVNVRELAASSATSSKSANQKANKQTVQAP